MTKRDPDPIVSAVQPGKARELKDAWQVFFWTFVHPVPAALLVVGIGLFLYSLSITERAFAGVLSLIVSVASGFLGNVMHKRWSDAMERGPLIERGNTAIRHLTLLMTNVTALRRRVSGHHVTYSKREKPDPLVEIYLSDVEGRCVLLQEAVLSAIEDWKGVIPSADVRTQIGEITEKEMQILALQEERDALDQRLSSHTGQTEEELTGLRHQLAAKNMQLEETVHELGEARRQARASGLPQLDTERSQLREASFLSEVIREALVQELTKAGGSSDYYHLYREVPGRHPEVADAIRRLERSGVIRIEGPFLRDGAQDSAVDLRGDEAKAVKIAFADAYSHLRSTPNGGASVSSSARQPYLKLP